MKIWPILLLITSCQAQVILTPKNPDDFGASVSFQNQNGVTGDYNFGYTEGHLSGGSFRRETGDAFGNKIGTYGYKTADGRVRVAQYVADENGFRIQFTTNEPGVAPQNPAFVNINKPVALPVPAAAVPVAPVAVPPPPPPPPPAVAVPSKVFPPPPASFNYFAPPVAPLAVPPPPPPPAYFPPLAQVAAPYAPVAVAPFSKRIAAYPPPPPPLPPPQAYYTNLVPGKGYVSAVNTYPSPYPPLAAVPPQYNFLSYKSPRPYPGDLVSIPL